MNLNTLIIIKNLEKKTLHFNRLQQSLRYFTSEFGMETDDWEGKKVYDAGWGYDHSGNSGLVGYWKFNEGSGNTVTDYGPYQKHGTLTSDANQGGSGTPTWVKNGSYE